jgi:hypothetical protein
MDDQSANQWRWEKIAEQCVKNLTKNGFDAHYVPDTQDATDKILAMVAPFQSFGFGGSSTTRQLGVMDVLRADGKTIHDHWQPDLDKAADLAIRLAQGRCDCFLCSANAIAATGEIVNVDGIGNRTNAMTFGTRKVVIVAGMNKVAGDLHAALRRVRDVAAPMRARSLNMKTPCAETGICSDCHAPQRICRITTILHRRPLLTDVSVFLIGQTLGY